MGFLFMFSLLGLLWKSAMHEDERIRGEMSKAKAEVAASLQQNVYGAWRDNAKAREIGVLGTESLLDSLIVVEILKQAARRNRPDEKDPGEFWGGGTSFPSGHSMQVWSIASLLAHEYKHKKLVGVTAYGLAGIVSASRIAAQKHFASDVFAGGTMGGFIGRYVYDTHMSHLAHKHAWLTPMIVPEIQPSQRHFV